MTSIFISYARDERPQAERLARFLIGHGFDVWWDTSLVAGDVFSAEIRQQIDAAQSVIVLWSEQSIRSRWVIDEADVASQQEKLVPCRIDDCDLPIGFRQIHTIDIREWDADLDIVLAALGGSRKPSPSTVPDATAEFEAIKQERLDWTKTRQQNTIEAYTSFRAAWPQSPHSEEALRLIEQHNKDADRQRERRFLIKGALGIGGLAVIYAAGEGGYDWLRHQEYQAWRKALMRFSVEDFQEYLSKKIAWKNSIHVKLANKIIKDLSSYRVHQRIPDANNYVNTADSIRFLQDSRKVMFRWAGNNNSIYVLDTLTGDVEWNCDVDWNGFRLLDIDRKSSNIIAQAYLNSTKEEKIFSGLIPINLSGSWKRKTIFSSQHPNDHIGNHIWARLDGNNHLFIVDSSELRLLDASTRKTIWHVEGTKPSWFSGPISIDRTGTIFTVSLLGRDKSEIVIGDMRSGKFINAIELGKGVIGTDFLDFHPKEKNTIIRGQKENIEVWNWKSQKRVRHFQVVSSMSEESVAITPSGTHGIAVDRDEGVSPSLPVLRVFSMENGNIIRSLYGHRHPVTDIDISQDGNLLASIDDKGFVNIWNLQKALH